MKSKEKSTSCDQFKITWDNNGRYRGYRLGVRRSYKQVCSNCGIELIYYYPLFTRWKDLPEKTKKEIKKNEGVLYFHG